MLICTENSKLISQGASFIGKAITIRGPGQGRDTPVLVLVRGGVPLSWSCLEGERGYFCPGPGCGRRGAGTLS